MTTFNGRKRTSRSGLRSLQGALYDSGKISVLDVLQNGSGVCHYMYVRNANIFASMAGGHRMLPGTTRNEAERKTSKRWTECVYQQHEDRMEFISRVHALYRMSGSESKNALFDMPPSISERRAIHILSGFAASGGMRNALAEPACKLIGKQPVHDDQPHVAHVKSKIFSPRVLVQPEWSSMRRSQADEHNQRFAAQLWLDLKQRKFRIRRRVSVKRPMSLSLLVRSRIHKKPASNAKGLGSRVRTRLGSVLH